VHESSMLALVRLIAYLALLSPVWASDALAADALLTGKPGAQKVATDNIGDTPATRAKREAMVSEQIEAHGVTLQGRDQAFEVTLVVPPPNRCTHQPAAGKVAHDHTGVGEPRDDVGRLVRGYAPRDQRRALLWDDDVASCIRQPGTEELRHLSCPCVPPVWDR